LSVSQSSRHSRHLHSFPTRRSSDLEEGVLMQILYAFAAVGNSDDMETLSGWYKRIKDDTQPGYDADAHAAADYALLKMGERFCKDRKSTRLNSSHVKISYAVFCLKK